LTRQIVFILISFFVCSCTKRLNETTIKGKDIEVSWYQTSEIATMHDFVEVKQGSSKSVILETESYGFTNILIKNDTIIIQYMPTVIYKVSDKVFGYKVQLDTTITIDNWRQKIEERENTKR
jgi:hypothetical protein